MAFVAMNAAYADLGVPYLLPLCADPIGFPPAFLPAGTRELILSNTVRLYRALRRAGALTELHVWEAMPHAGFSESTSKDAEVYAEVRASSPRCDVRPGRTTWPSIPTGGARWWAVGVPAGAKRSETL